jgi:hypothetical protein
LPNDGFVYTKNYKEEGTDMDLNMNKKDALTFAEYLMKFVVNQNLKNFSPELQANYREDKHRVEFYFTDEINLKCVTVKYEYGWYDFRNSKKRVYTLEELQEKIKNLEK